jgi:hypothetical protein
MKKKIWTPYKIWDETEWFTDFEKEYSEFLRRIHI